jgi:hypothetical protein
MVFETVQRARRRILANEALRHAAYAMSAALAALIVLLLVGTQVLGWVWLALVPALTLAAGAYATWRRVPSPYQTAQRVDRNLRLADTLSTALFYAARPGDTGRAAADMRRAQWSQAERMAATLDTRRAIPIRPPRALYVTALLALMAASLFALRYGLDRRLDLRAPLARMVEEKLGYGEARQAQDRKNVAAHEPNHLEDAGVSPDESGRKGAGELDAAPDSALDTVGEPDVDQKTGSSRPDDATLAQSSQLDGGQNESGEPEGISANAGNQPSGDGKQGPGAGKQGQGNDKQVSGNSGENSSLLGKFRDAMSSLLKRMGQQPGARGTQQQAGAQGGRQKGAQSNAGQNGKQGQQPGDGEQANSKDGQPGDDSQDAQSSQPGGPGESGQQPATKQPGSGIGRQDGSKDVKLAEQLAAMGKISEIIGKRAANVTGEVTVEVENSNQQLRTPYAQRAAHHAEAGGEIHRDEVPVALQAYVQQYFEQVRKQAASSATPARGRHRTEPAKPGL